MRPWLFPLLILSLVARSQTIVEIKPEKHIRLDSLVKTAPISDGAKRALVPQALRVMDKSAGHAAYHLGTDYGLLPSEGMTLLKAVPGMTKDQAKQDFPDCFRGLTEERLPNGQPRFTVAQAETYLLDMSKADACWCDALWKNSPYVPLTGSRGLLLSNNNITVPNGGYWCAGQWDMAYGTYRGTGNFNSSDLSGLGGTEIHMWHDKWHGDPVNRVMLNAFHGGSDNFYAYSEGQQLHDIRVNGHADTLKRAGRTITGVRAWDTGSGSNYSNLFIHHCDEGLDVVRGTPFTGSGTISLFSNTVCGLCLTGGSGGSQSFETVELDDNSRGIWSRPGWGRPAGVELEIDMTKMEELVTPARFYRPNTIVLEGWVRAQFTAISTAAAWGYLGDLIEVNANINTSHVQIGDLRGFGNRLYQTVIYDKLNGEHLLFDNGYSSRILNVDWYSDMGGTVYVRPNTSATMVPTTRGSGRLGYLLAGSDGQPAGSFDLAATKPSWTDEGGNGSTTGPPPVACTSWGTPSAWGPCVNGTQSRTVPTLPAGCTGTPPGSKPKETRTCTAPPVVTKWSSCSNAQTCKVTSPNSMAGAGLVMPATANPVNTMVLTNVMFSDVGFGWINDRVTIHNGTIYLNPSGSTYTPSATYTGLVAGTLYPRIELPLTGYTIAWAVGNGSNSVKMTADKVEYF